MRGGLTAGLRYGAEAFALGCALGLIRVTLLIPLLGALPAVLIEVPIILVAMGGRAAVIIRRSKLHGLIRRAEMGATGFAVLMICEILLGLTLGTSLPEWLATLTTPAGSVGLAGQILFAIMPLIVPIDHSRR